MKSHWKIKKIGDVCSLMTGGTPSKQNPKYFGGKIRWLVSGDIHQKEIFECEGRITRAGMDNSNARFLPVNSVMIALNGQGKTRGSVSILRVPATCNQSLVSIYPNEPKKLLPEFIYANLRSRYQEIRRLTGDAGNERRGLNMGILRNMEIPIAPLSEQRRIVASLDRGVSYIAKARITAETNRRNARSLFESYIQSIFDRHEDKWPKKQLGDLSKISYGYTESATWDSVGPKFLRITDIQDSRVDWSTVPFCALDKSDYPKYALASGDIVFARTGATTGKSYLLVSPPRAVCASYLIRVRPNNADLLPKFLFLFFQTETYWNAIRDGLSGSAQGGFNATKLGELVVPYPKSKKDQLGIVKESDRMLREIRRLESIYQRKANILDELVESLLDYAFVGGL